MILIELPNTVEKLLEHLDAPERLKRHLQLVHATAHDLAQKLKHQWPQLTFDKRLVLFGAATHDIGKAKIQSELYEQGHEHEAKGREILEAQGFSSAESRFAITHANWQTGTIQLEDVLVSLSDKIWKGKRVLDLEEKVGHMIADALNVDYWDVYTNLDSILEQLSQNADARILWQNKN